MWDLDDKANKYNNVMKYTKDYISPEKMYISLIYGRIFI